MKIPNFGILAFVILALEAAAGAQVLSDAQVEAAIKAGQNQKYDHLVSTCVAPGFTMNWDSESPDSGKTKREKSLGSYRITASGNGGRVAFLAAEAQRRHLPFTVSDVPEAARQPGVFVLADPHEPKRENETLSMTPPIELIWVEFWYGKKVGSAEPDSVAMELVEWPDATGGTIASTRGLVFYSAVQLWPKRDFQVVVYGLGGGFHRCKIKKKDWTEFSRAQ